MFNKNSIASFILAGTILMTGTAAAYAVKVDKSSGKAPNSSISIHFDSEKMHARVKSALDGLVKEGKITESQKDAVLAEIEAKIKKFRKEGKGPADRRRKGPFSGKCKPGGHKHGFLRDLVKAGTITQEQADAIREAIKSAHDSEKKTK